VCCSNHGEFTYSCRFACRSLTLELKALSVLVELGRLYRVMQQNTVTVTVTDNLFRHELHKNPTHGAAKFDTSHFMRIAAYFKLVCGASPWVYSQIRVHSQIINVLTVFSRVQSLPEPRSVVTATLDS
jgi:hypothetical protein